MSKYKKVNIKDFMNQQKQRTGAKLYNNASNSIGIKIKPTRNGNVKNNGRRK